MEKHTQTTHEESEQLMTPNKVRRMLSVVVSIREG